MSRNRSKKLPNVSINCKLEELRVMEVEVVSKDYVKPCRPTPPELRIYRVSLLDQLMLTAHVPIIVFYDRPTMFSTEEALRRLKSSASEALPDFYPFAGRIKDDLCIDCNDAGVYYTEARVNCSVRDLIGKPDGQLIQKLLPAEPDDQSSEGIHIVMVQVNEFTCGGIAIAAYLSHKIIDGPTIVTLLKAWSSTARGRPGEVKPSFVAPSIFPQSDKLTSDYLLGIWPALLKVGKYATRRFVFDTEAVAKIKAGAASPSLVAHPTRVESVSAFIWRCCMRAAEARDGSRNPSVLTHMINLRLGKAGDEGPIPEHTIGNLLWVITARSEPEAERDLKPLTAAIREGFLGIRAEMFEQFAGEDGASRMQECLEEIRKVYEDEGTDYFAFTSLFNMGVYEADFGWGRPMWVSPGGVEGEIYQNLVFLMETRGGGGIEAWITLGEQDMALLEVDEELLSFASLDLSPLELL